MNKLDTSSSLKLTFNSFTGKLDAILVFIQLHNKKATEQIDLEVPQTSNIE